MTIRLPLLAICGLLLTACSSIRTTDIVDVVDLPLNSTDIPPDSWEHAPLRAHAQYLLFGANTRKQRKAKLGDYYFVNWYDAQPDQSMRLLMSYTQAKTGSKVLHREERLSDPREEAGDRQTTFFFNGEDRAKRGDVLSWKIELFVNDEPVAKRQSYLWE